MKNIRKTIVVCATLLGISMVIPVYADESVAGGSNSMLHQHNDPVANAERHLSVFKSELKITPDQEQSWMTYAEKTKRNVKEIRDRMNEAMHDKPQTAPERFDRHIELMKERLASFERMDDALKQLYAVLTPEQRAIADQHFAKMHH